MELGNIEERKWRDLTEQIDNSETTCINTFLLDHHLGLTCTCSYAVGTKKEKEAVYCDLSFKDKPQE